MSNWSDLNDKPCDFIWTTARPDVSHGCNLRDGHQGVHVCCSCKVTSALVRCPHNRVEMLAHEDDIPPDGPCLVWSPICRDCGADVPAANEITPSSSAPTPEMES